MHGSIAACRLTDLQFDDEAKRIEGCAKMVDDGEWIKVRAGLYSGFPSGGGYARRWPDLIDPKLMRYTPTLAEVSILDTPCVPTATFEVIKADRSVELRKCNISRRRHGGHATALHGNPYVSKPPAAAGPSCNLA